MTITRILSARVLVVIVLVMFLPHILPACPVCFGSAEASNSNEIRGISTAILAMLGITGVVLTAIGSFFISMIVRIRRLRNGKENQVFVNEKGDTQWNSF